MTKAKRVLPSDVYDTLELSALAFGGIGGGVWYEYEAERDPRTGLSKIVAPVCAIGHWEFARGKYNRAMALHDITTDESDNAVVSINKRRRRDGYQRVTFERWCAELGVERGR